MTDFVDHEKRRASLGLTRVPPFQFDETLRSIMRRRRLSGAAIATFVGVSPAAVSRWCAGLDVPSEKNLVIVADALGVTRDFLATFRPDLIATLTLAVCPGEVMSQEQDAAIRQAERDRLDAKQAPRREAAQRKEAARHAAALRQAEAETIRTASQRLLDEQERENRAWHNRMASMGNRCIVCKRELRFPGMCAACASGDRPKVDR